MRQYSTWKHLSIHRMKWKAKLFTYRIYRQESGSIASPWNWLVENDTFLWDALKKYSEIRELLVQWKKPYWAPRRARYPLRQAQGLFRLAKPATSSPKPMTDSPTSHCPWFSPNSRMVSAPAVAWDFVFTWFWIWTIYFACFNQKIIFSN